VNLTTLAAAIGVVFIAAIAARTTQIDPETGAALSVDSIDQAQGDESVPDQSPSLMESIAVKLDPSTYTPAAVDASTADRNVRAFLDTLAVSEGTAGVGDDGYNVLFGGGLFYDYGDHPRQFITRTQVTGRTVTSTAAGRYQMLSRTWDGLRNKLGLPDFSPASQDAGAIELISERGALRDVQAGRFATALAKCKGCWASLPGAGYGQPEQSFSRLQAVYAAAGGSFESQA
jgi:lysozyme